MEKLVNEIVALFDINSRISRRMWTGYVGVILSVIFASISFKEILRIIENAKLTSDGCQEVVLILSSIMSTIIVLWLTYYLIKFFALLVITLIRYGVSFTSKIRKDSIVSIMTTEVEDKRRMYKAIIRYLKEYSTPTHFAALYIWLTNKQLICPTDQVRFLELLKADFLAIDNKPKSKGIQINVPSASSFSEAKTKLEKDDNMKGIFMFIESKLYPFISDNGQRIRNYTSE